MGPGPCVVLAPIGMHMCAPVQRTKCWDRGQSCRHRMSLTTPPIHTSSTAQKHPITCAQENEAAKRGLDPLLFHCCNVVWHALVSALVCR